MKLIAEWRQSWRLWSVRLSALGAILTGLALAAPDFLQSLWNGLPADARALLPTAITHAVPTALFVLTIVARVVAQNAPKTAASEAAQQTVNDATDHLTPLLHRVTAVESMIRDVLSGVDAVRAAQLPAVSVSVAPVVAASPNAEVRDAAAVA